MSPALFHNPLLVRSLRQRARQGRTPWIILLCLVALALLVGALGGVAAEGSGSPADVGTRIFTVFFVIASGLAAVLGAAMGAHSLASEHQARTWEALLLTGMNPRQIVQNCFVTAYANLALYIVALAPVCTVAFVFGGVSALEVALALLFVLILAALAVAYGLAVGAALPRLGALGAAGSMILLYFTFSALIGGLGVFLADVIWPTLHLAGAPLWWTAVVARAPLDADYFLYAWALPLYCAGALGWLLLEAAVAQVLEPGQDRLFSFKRALLSCQLLWAVLGVLAIAVARDDRRVNAALLASLLVLGAYALLGLFLAADDVYPARRARHDLQSASWGRRLLGPSVVRGALLNVLVWMAALLVVSAAGLVRRRHLLIGWQPAQLFAILGYLISFVLACNGLMVYTRAGRASVAASRLAPIAASLVLTASPWVLFAIAGGVSSGSDTSLLALASPSPAYAAAMAAALERSNVNPAVLLAGVVVCLGYMLIGQLLFALAARRAKTAYEIELRYQHEVDERMRLEDNPEGGQASA